MSPTFRTHAGAFHAARNSKASKRVRMDMQIMLPERNNSDNAVIVITFLVKQLGLQLLGTKLRR